MDEMTELERLRKENERLKQEGTNLRAQLYFLREESKEIRDKAFAQRFVLNGVGQHFCPRCFALVWEPPNIPVYWRKCQYANKEPPSYCPKCGQHVEVPPGAELPQYEEAPLKNQHKGEQKHGTWNYRR